MVSLTTHTALPAPPPRLAYGQVGLSFGSCFSERIAGRLRSGGLALLANPFGIQYNPLSIAQGLERLLDPVPFTVSDLVQRDGLYHSFAHHGRFSHPDPTVVLERINTSLSEAAAWLERADYLLVTWGTAYVYRLSGSSLGAEGSIVSNCHKYPEKTFVRYRTRVDELVASWLPLLERLLERAPQLRLIQTVSPVRHLRDGAHGNALSKSTLLLFAEALADRFPEHLHYYPAYEILLDELRDYRFFADDLTHPSSLAERVIWERFVDWCIEPETKRGMAEFEAYHREAAHRMLHATPEALARREAQLHAKRESLSARYPQAIFTDPTQWID